MVGVRSRRLRRLAGGTVAIAMAGCAIIVRQPIMVPAAYPALEQETFALVNSHRAAEGLRPLVWDEAIASQCRAHCARMACADRYLGHEGFHDRVKSLRSTIVFVRASENVGSNAGFEDPVAAAVQGWLDSPPHRQGIEGPYETTGIGVNMSDSGTYYFTEIFVAK